ncbi:hypothetical protein Tco_0578184 [Tanacetum coccineum]
MIRKVQNIDLKFTECACQDTTPPVLCKAPYKGSKTGKSASAKEPVEEPIAEVVMDDAGEDVVALDQPEQPWFNQMVSATKDPLTFNDLMATPIDFSKYYLKSSDLEKTYTTSITKTKAARYKIEGIEDMVPTLWSPTKVGYGDLEEIVVKRADCYLYKFKEGDFVDLHLNDIEDMLLLVVQHKLFHLTDNDIVDFIVALRMFTRSLIIKKRVEDLQLGVESYEKKLNITPPQQTFPE